MLLLHLRYDRWPRLYSGRGGSLRLLGVSLPSCCCFNPGRANRRVSQSATFHAAFALPKRPGFSAAQPSTKPGGHSDGGFCRLPPPPRAGWPTATAAAFRYALAVSRRTPVSCSIRRKDQPRRPNAITCCCFSSRKTLLMPTKGTLPCVESTSQDQFSLAGLKWPSLAFDKSEGVVKDKNVLSGVCDTACSPEKVEDRDLGISR